MPRAHVEMNWSPEGAEEAIRDGIAKGERQAGERLLELANKTVPRDKGDLAASGTVNVDETTGEASISYDASYAVEQHEDQQYRHRGTGRAKWLELTMEENPDVLEAMVGDALKEALK